MSRAKKAAGDKYIRQNVSMDPQQLERLILYCQREERPISWVIRQALNKYLNDNVA